jgi:hypothetical protein
MAASRLKSLRRLRSQIQSWFLEQVPKHRNPGHYAFDVIALALVILALFEHVIRGVL